MYVVYANVPAVASSCNLLTVLPDRLRHYVVRAMESVTKCTETIVPALQYFNSFKSFKEPVKECLKSIAAMLQKVPVSEPVMLHGQGQNVHNSAFA